MINLITSRSGEYDSDELAINGINLSRGKDFQLWLNLYEDDIQLDTETNVVRDVIGWKRDRKGKKGWTDPVKDENGNLIPENRECYVVQIGDRDGKVQWIFDVPGLSGAKYDAMLNGLKCDNTKLIHNALFDYVVIKSNFNIDIVNVRDTFLMSKILCTGIDAADLPYGHNSLAGCASRYLGIDISKSAQTTFTGDAMSPEQIVYAASDVTILGLIEKGLNKEIQEYGLENLVKLESAVTRVYGDSMCEGFYLDKDEWVENIKMQEEQCKNVQEELLTIIKEEFYDKAVENRFIQKDDQYAFSWTGRNLKKALMRLPYPNLPDNCTTQKQMSDWLKEYYTDIDNDVERDEDPDMMEMYLNKNYEELEMAFISRYNKELIDMGLFTKAGSMMINFNSPEQVTRLFQMIDPSIESSGVDVLKKINHPMATAYRKYTKASKLMSSYGENFFDWIAPDGQLRVPSYQQILATGRSSMKLYQLLPGQSIYRNPFKPNNPKTGTRNDGHKWKVIGADYSSQELCVLAVFANEPAMLDAIRNGYDLHSISASLLFPEAWAKLGGEKKPKGKPSNPELVKFRSWSKTTSFGIVYGMSSIGLGESLGLPATTIDLIDSYPEQTNEFLDENSDEYQTYCDEYKKGRKSATSLKEFLKIEHEEGRYLPDVITGDDLIKRFYKAYPNVKNFLTISGETAKVTLMSTTPDPFQRIRFFTKPDYDSGYSAIERAGTNSRIQGSSANMTKYALLLFKKEIETRGLQNKLKFLLPIHDEIQAIAREDFAEEGLKILINCMERAGEAILGNRLQKAEGDISDYWIKD